MALPGALRSLGIPLPGRDLSIDDLLERWRDALLYCLPARLRRLLARREQHLILVPQGTTASLFLSQQGETLDLGKLDPQMPGAAQALLASVSGRRRRTLVRLGEDQILKRRVSFPAQVEANLAQVLEYEMDRLSPFASDQVYFDFRVVGQRSRTDKIGVDLALCRREQVKDWLAVLRENGSPAERVTWDGAWPKANLLPASERPQQSRKAFKATLISFLVVTLLATAALATPLWQLEQIRDARKEQIVELKGRADKVHEMRTALERARAGSVAVLKRKWEQPRMIDLLLELTERLPDDTWIQNLDFSDGEIRIRGESAQATALLNLLDQAPGITEVSFRSPVVQVSGSDRERFHIALKYTRPEQS